MNFPPLRLTFLIGPSVASWDKLSWLLWLQSSPLNLGITAKPNPAHSRPWPAVAAGSAVPGKWGPWPPASEPSWPAWFKRNFWEEQARQQEGVKTLTPKLFPFAGSVVGGSTGLLPSHVSEPHTGLAPGSSHLLEETNRGTIIFETGKRFKYFLSLYCVSSFHRR